MKIDGLGCGKKSSCNLLLFGESGCRGFSRQQVTIWMEGQDYALA